MGPYRMIGKILIVDDVSTNRIVFKVKLTAAGYASAMAADGASCLHLARTELPDLILLDLMLPDMSGIDVLRQLKSNPMTRRIPVVMFSSEHDPVLRVAALRAGAEDFSVAADRRSDPARPPAWPVAGARGCWRLRLA